MPAVIPAEVQIVSSHMKIGSASTQVPGKASGQSGATAPMRDGSLPVEQADLTQQEGTGADGRDASRGRGARSQPRGETRIGSRRLDPFAAGDHQRIQRSIHPGKGRRDQSQSR